MLRGDPASESELQRGKRTMYDANERLRHKSVSIAAFSAGRSPPAMLMSLEIADQLNMAASVRRNFEYRAHESIDRIIRR